MKMYGLLCVLVTLGVVVDDVSAQKELKPPVVTIPAEPIPASELSPEARRVFEAAVFPGELSIPNVGILYKNGALAADNWFREPTTNGINAMKALAADPAGRELLRDVAQIIPAANDAKQRVPVMLRLLVADQGMDRELAWLTCVFMLNPEGAATRNEQAASRLPHVTLLGGTHKVQLTTGTLTVDSVTEDITVVVAPLEHRNRIYSAPELAAVYGRVEKIQKRYKFLTRRP